MSYSNDKQQMLDFIQLTSLYLAETTGYGSDLVSEDVPMEDVGEVVMLNPALMEDLRDLVFTLRAHMESETSGDYALGVETGMQRVADMIETIINRYDDGGSIE